jgi:hypothetical protein
MDALITMIAGCTEIKTLKGWEKTFPSEVVPVIQTRIAELTKKPWKPKMKFTDRGGLVLPQAVYLDGVDALIEMLVEYKSHDSARPYSKS